eukprot:2974216-Pleurochrysis_carterae.AAC.4
MALVQTTPTALLPLLRAIGDGDLSQLRQLLLSTATALGRNARVSLREGLDSFDAVARKALAPVRRSLTKFGLPGATSTPISARLVFIADPFVSDACDLSCRDAPAAVVSAAISPTATDRRRVRRPRSRRRRGRGPHARTRARVYARTHARTQNSVPAIAQ